MPAGRRVPGGSSDNLALGMIQEWTICTIVGAALPDLEDLFAQWTATRAKVEDADSSFPDRTMKAAECLMALLEEHRTLPPVVYYSKHVDLWSSFGVLFSFIPNAPPAVSHASGHVWTYRMPARGKLVRRTQRVRLNHQHEEDLWLANSLEAAATAYRPLWTQALLLIQRRAITISPTDEDLLAAAAARPVWLGKHHEV